MTTTEGSPPDDAGHQRPHSAAHFTSNRDHWWNADYLDLLARRHDLAGCRRVLELGAGVGHWTGILLRHCAPDATFLLVEREPEWIDRLGQKFADLPRVSVLRADVNDLSGLEGPFDLVTCQTLLLHLDDVVALLRAARRLLAPGGLLFLAEPNNLANRIQGTPASGLTPTEFGALAALWWAYEIGRTRLGLGREWIAEALPGLIAQAGFVDLDVRQNDKAWPRHAPYCTQDQLDVYGPPGPPSEDGGGSDPREEVRTFALAGGLDEEGFARGWAACEASDREIAQALADQRHSACGAGNLFIFAARAPTGGS